MESLSSTHGFQTEVAIMDGEFEVLYGDLADMKICLQATTGGKYVGAIERHIRTIKEHCRTVFYTLLFKSYITTIMIAVLLY